MKKLWVVLILGISSLFADAKIFAVDFGGRRMPPLTFSKLVAESFCEKSKCAKIPQDSLLGKVRNGSADSSKVFRVNRYAALEILHLDRHRRDFLRRDFDEARDLLRQYGERDDNRPLTQEFLRLNAALDLYDSLQSDAFWQNISLSKSELSPDDAQRILFEERYLRVNLPFFAWIFLCASFALSLFSIAGKGRLEKWSFRLAVGLQACAFLLIGGTFVWRGIVSARVPLVTLYEMVLALIFGLSLLNILVAVKKKSRGIFSALAGVNVLLFLLVRSALSAGDPFGRVSPMLDSPFWLSLHVFTIASGFCLLLVSSLLAHGSLLLRFLGKAVSESFKNFSVATLRAGFGLSALGTLLGGFWAKVAWGRFWGFDPKENGALLVLLWVLILLHLKAGRLVREKTLEILQALLAVIIAFCLFGVNLLGVGLHSYGYSPGVFSAFVGFVAFDILFVWVMRFRGRGKGG